MPGPATRLILVRHGESVLGRARRYAGHRDTALTAEGRRQIRRLRPRFARLNPDVIFTSDLRRCRETARLLAPGRDVRASIRLRELDFGSWEGRTASSCRRSDPARFDRWMRDPESVSPPGGESLPALRRRVRSFVSSLARRFPARTVALVTHGGVIRALLAPDAPGFWGVKVPFGALIESAWPAGRCAGS